MDRSTAGYLVLTGALRSLGRPVVTARRRSVEEDYPQAIPLAGHLTLTFDTASHVVRVWKAGQSSGSKQVPDPQARTRTSCDEEPCGGCEDDKTKRRDRRRTNERRMSFRLQTATEPCFHDATKAILHFSSEA
ncbi:hypothetical protein HaLaN_32128 [Haematococcus lacustris]|uniref:Uncharacterized protein n=1 Tax=Haematococcus lacustris TaxID=44745 RepID=A0A6A0AKK7_HAELA|nr:hypothetical protein HaLaN_32128 [Haematococcus lacustris]